MSYEREIKKRQPITHIGHALEEDDRELAEQIGRVCREAREKLTLTQAEVASMVGFNASYYGRIERGDSMPSLSKLLELGTVLAVSVDYMLGMSESDWGWTVKPAIPDSQALRRVLRLLSEASPETRQTVLEVLEKIHGTSSSTKAEEEEEEAKAKAKEKIDDG